MIKMTFVKTPAELLKCSVLMTPDPLCTNCFKFATFYKNVRHVIETYVHYTIIQCVLKKRIVFLHTCILQKTDNISGGGLLVTVCFSQFLCFNF